VIYAVGTGSARRRESREFSAGGTATKRETGNSARPALEQRLSGLSRVGGSLKSANKLLTGDPGTIDTTQQMETLCN
jgi:hypothetical protein